MLFTDLQQNTLRAAMNRIVPADDFPAAWDAGCGDYITGQLTGQLAHLLPAYRAGLDGLESEAWHRHQRGFSELSAEDQDALLLIIEAGEAATGWQTKPDAFLAMLVNHTAEGYYADPGQGGNHNRVSWQMIGFNGR